MRLRRRENDGRRESWLAQEASLAEQGPLIAAYSMMQALLSGKT